MPGLYQSISEMTEADLPLDGTEDMEIVQGGVTRRCSTQDVADLAGGTVKVWRGLVSQAGTANPTVIELENTLGGAVTFTRSVAGLYTIGSTGLFTTDKTFVSPKWETVRQSANYGSVLSAYSNDSQVSVSTYLNGTLADDLLVAHPIQILVYP